MSLDHRRLRDVASQSCCQPGISLVEPRRRRREKNKAPCTACALERRPLVALAALWRVCTAGESSETLPELNLKGGFHPQAVIWVIRLTSPHLPYRVRQPQGRSDGRKQRCCSLLRVCSYRAGFSHPPYTPSKPLQPRLSGAERNRTAVRSTGVSHLVRPKPDWFIVAASKGRRRGGHHRTKQHINQRHSGCATGARRSRGS